MTSWPMSKMSTIYTTNTHNAAVEELKKIIAKLNSMTDYDGIRQINLLFCHLVEGTPCQIGSPHCFNRCNVSGFPIGIDFFPVVWSLYHRSSKFDSASVCTFDS